MNTRIPMMPAPVNGRRIAIALGALALGAVAMGASPIFVRLADVGPYASAFWRATLALPFFWVWTRVEVRQNEAGSGADWTVLLAGLLFAIDLFFWHLSILATTVANAAFFATTSPIWVAIGAWLILRETIHARVVWGITLCLLGGAALVGQSYSFAPQRLLGDIFGLTTAFFFGSYVIAVRAARRHVSAAQLSFVSTAITAAILFVVAIVFERTLLPGSIQGAGAVLALAIVSQVGGQGLLAVALGTLPATFSSLVIFLEAIAAAALGWIFLGEALSLLQAVGGALILFGILIARPR